MKLSFRKDVNHHYLVIESDHGEEVKAFIQKMLCENKIQGFLDCSSRKMDGKQLYYYEITSMQSIGEMFAAREMQYKDLCFLMDGLRNAIRSAEKYLLPWDKVLLDPDAIFMDPERQEIRFCYYPLLKESMQLQLEKLGETIVKKLDHEDKKAVELGYRFYSQITEGKESLEKVLRPVGEIPPVKQETAPDRGRGNMWYYRSDPEKEQEEQSVSHKEENLGEAIPFVEKEKKKSPLRSLKCLIVPIITTILYVAAVFFFPMNRLQTLIGLFLLASVNVLFSLIPLKSMEKEEKGEKAQIQEMPVYEEVYVPSEEEVVREMPTKEKTQRLKMDFQKYRRLESEDGEILFVIKQDQVIVGRAKERVDLVLENNGVSRIHAKLEEGVDGFYLSDLQSMNGTYLNGERIDSEDRKKLTTQDRISFAGVSFFFKEAEGFVAVEE